MANLKKVALTFQGLPTTVGDGFEIRRPFPTRRFPETSPFILLDHAGPTEIPPSDTPKGVDAHPHKGFETVTILLSGELEHRDSFGNQGYLKPGDVQWMTAGAGIVHEEKHGRDFSRQGGTLELLQLWVNLPAAHKNEPPGYQDIKAASIPNVPLPNDSGFVRVIAGSWQGHTGPARTFTPMQVLQGSIPADGTATFSVPEKDNTIVYLLDGNGTVNNEELAAGTAAFFQQSGTEIVLKAQTPLRFLLLSGTPLGEPVVSYGPFVMNTQEEIAEAIQDFRAGKMGTLD
jgi:redox-sensitive bicupin YhaK (pirin superfamily)